MTSLAYGILVLLVALLAQDRPTSHFEFVDVFIDPSNKPLAAYQFELKADANVAQIVGVEGGEHLAFKPAPFYDPAALTKNRIIIAAFNTSSDLPRTKTRVARLHMRVTGDVIVQYQLHLETSVNLEGADLGAKISIEQGRTP